MSFIDILLKIAMMVLQEVWDDIDQQQNKVNTEGIEKTNRFMSLLGQPDFWDGDDADTLKGELTRIVLPNMDRVTGIARRTNDGLREAVNIINAADRQVSQMVNNLASEFSSIF